MTDKDTILLQLHIDISNDENIKRYQEDRYAMDKIRLNKSWVVNKALKEFFKDYEGLEEKNGK